MCQNLTIFGKEGPSHCLPKESVLSIQAIFLTQPLAILLTESGMEDFSDTQQVHAAFNVQDEHMLFFNPVSRLVHFNRPTGCILLSFDLPNLEEFP